MTKSKYCCTKFEEVIIKYECLDWSQNSNGEIEKYFLWDGHYLKSIPVDYCPWCAKPVPWKEKLTKQRCFLCNMDSCSGESMETTNEGVTRTVRHCDNATEMFESYKPSLIKVALPLKMMELIQAKKNEYDREA
jgi:hypothetical protein